MKTKKRTRNWLFCAGIVFFLLLPVAGNAAMVSIAAESVNMRAGPGKRYAVVWKLGKGYPLTRLRRKGKWIKVKDFENDVGWVYEPLTSRKPHLIVKKKLVNIRSGPGTRYRIVSKAEYGVVFRTLKRRGGLKNGWVKVRHEDGITGWIKRSLLWGW